MGWVHTYHRVWASIRRLSAVLFNLENDQELPSRDYFTDFRFLNTLTLGKPFRHTRKWNHCSGDAWHRSLVTGSLNESKLRSLQEMTDSTKKGAIAFLEEMLLLCSYQSQSIHFLPLISYRTVRITLQYGRTKISCVGKIFFVTLFSTFTISSVRLTWWTICLFV